MDDLTPRTTAEHMEIRKTHFSEIMATALIERSNTTDAKERFRLTYKWVDAARSLDYLNKGILL